MAVLILIPVAGGAIAYWLVPEVNWRARVIALRLGGDISDLSWPELLRMLRPGSRYYLKGILETRNPYSVIVNPYATVSDVAAGAEMFRRKCTTCHETHAHGVPDLRGGRFKWGESDWALYRNITRGIAGTAMVAQQVDEKQAWQLVAYVRSRGRRPTGPASAGAEGGPAGPELQPVTYDALLNDSRTPADWLTYSGGYNGWRYSALDQVNRDNAGALTLQWAYQMATSNTEVEASPIVVGDRMYVSEPPNNVIALDARNGRKIWRYERRLPDDLSLCCGRVNRGVAVLGERVYIATLDARLVALDARNGAVVWDVEVADPKRDYSITAAPLAVKDLILVGISGGEYGIRGFLDAYDAKTGARRWRFHTIPGPGEPGNETWAGESWRKGGGPTWVTGSFDPDLDLVFWGVGNPNPDFQGGVRKGDNLYTNSMVALDVDTGKLKWHFQFTPHDQHDWDANLTPILADLEVDGVPRRLLLAANKNGFYYVLDRETGAFVAGRPFAKQSWARGLDPSGRPVRTENSGPSQHGTYVVPSASGATNWWPASYNPSTGLVYLPVIEKGAVFFKHAVEDLDGPRPGEQFLGSATQFVTGEPVRTFVRALVPATGALKWEHAFPVRQTYGVVGGILSTAGGVVFLGNDTAFYAFDAATGARLWQVNLGGRINAPPVSYMSNGRQLITIAAGRSIFTLGLGAP